MNESPDLIVNARHKLNRRWILAGFGLLLFILAVGGGFLYWKALNRPIPYKYKREFHFPLYYPATLPNGYTVDTKSFKSQDGVFIFNISSPNGRGIAVAEQAIPSDLNLSEQNPSGIKLPGEVDLTTAVGPAQISLWGDKTVSSLVTTKTWIILNVTSIPGKDAQAVTRTFYQVH